VTAYVLTPAARADLADIWLYTADRWGVEQADAYVRRIEDDLADANATPLARPFEGKWRIRSGHHLCIFRVVETDTIEVVRILHERMDPSLHLR
jgi:toxin ParE1/3/4